MNPALAPARAVCLAVAVSITLVSPARAENVTVFAAASLTEVLKELGQAYQKQTGHQVDFNFGPSSDLARQIKAGAPADVFFSADSAQMDGLVAAGLVKADARHEVLSNTLVVIVPEHSSAAMSGPADLARFSKLALANPEAVPVGVYTRKYLEGLGLWDDVQPHVVPTLDVRATLAAVAGGSVDAGVVYRTDAPMSKDVKVVYEVPRADGPSIVYPLAPIAASKHADTVGLVRFLVSGEARKAYERFGFIVILPK
jgi:molybdate transport system substrate-binding protein